MPDTRITKERLKNHWMYSSWKYLLMIVIFVAGWNLIYSITEYKPPRERRLELYVLSNAYVTENMEALEAELEPLFVGEEEGDMEEFNIYVMNYGGEDDVYGPQLLMTRLASLEGDVYMVDETTLTLLISQELALPLDDYIATGALDVEGQNLDTVTRTAPAGEDEEGNTIYSDERHVYALPAQPLYGLIDEDIIDNRGLYFVVMAYTEKPDLCVELLNELSVRFRRDKPDWLLESEERQRQEIAALPSELTVDSLKAQATPEPTADPAAATAAPEGQDAAATAAPEDAQDAAATAAPEDVQDAA